MLLYHCHFICKISSIVGSKKQDFWPKINILKEKKILSMNVSSSKIGHDFRKQSGSEIESRKKCLY